MVALLYADWDRNKWEVGALSWMQRLRGANDDAVTLTEMT